MYELSKDGRVFTDCRAIPTIVLELFLTLIQTQFRSFPDTRHNFGILSAQLSLRADEADNVVAHNFRPKRKHFWHVPVRRDVEYMSISSLSILRHIRLATYIQLPLDEMKVFDRRTATKYALTCRNPMAMSSVWDWS